MLLTCKNSGIVKSFKSFCITFYINFLNIFAKICTLLSITSIKAFTKQILLSLHLPRHLFLLHMKIQYATWRIVYAISRGNKWAKRNLFKGKLKGHFSQSGKQTISLPCLKSLFFGVFEGYVHHYNYQTFMINIIVGFQKIG